jgi:glycosyltransferase involved in cell wall biosynthesis
MNPTRIGIDGYNLALPNGTGVATYGYTLAATLQSSGHAIDGIFGIDAGHDPALRETLFYEVLGKPLPERKLEQRRRERRQLRRHALNPFAFARAAEIPCPGRVITSPLADRLPAFDRITTSPRLFDLAHQHFAYFGRMLPVRMTAPPAIMHWTYPVPLRLVGARNLYTLHDLVPLRLPYTTLDNKTRYRRLLAAVARSADHLCTVSEASRDDIMAEFELPADRITNTYQSAIIPPELLSRAPAEDAGMIENIFGLTHRDYFVYFGAIEPKKNVGRMIEAYLALGSRTPLVIVGGRSWQAEGELALLTQHLDSGESMSPALSGRIFSLTHLSRALLLRLVRGARAALFPSIAEGFGLPILEAMLLGTPVLTSASGATAEVAGEAAILVDPYDPLAMTAAMRRLDDDRTLRARLERAGLERARMFSTDRYASRLEEMYRRTLTGAG